MLVTIATFSFPHEARIAKARLDALGIPSFIADEHTINMQWLYSNALGGVRLQVPQAVAAEALAALNEDAGLDDSAADAREEDDAAIPGAAEAGGMAMADGNPPVPAPPMSCPYCGGALGEPFVMGQPPALLRWLLPPALWPVRRVRRCLACGDLARVQA